MKIRNYLGLLVILLFATACPNDDDDDFITVEMRDRGEQSIADDALLREYFETHFYNYEEFQNPPEDFDFQIVFDTIAGDNAERTPLIEQVVDTTYIRSGASQTLYKLTAREGAGALSSIADSVFMTLQGVNLSGGAFENAENPLWFDLLGTVDGFMQGLGNVRGASDFSINPDGTTSFSDDFEVGAIFIPSGLGFFAAPPSSNIPLFSNLIFTYNVFDVEVSDHDDDGIRSFLEDVDGNGFFFDAVDDTDGDSIFNFVDLDDDGDGVLTELEILTTTQTIINSQGEEEEVEVFESFLDTDGDGISDHLDNDDDGDGRPTQSEINFNATTNVITFTDTDGDGTPDYLDADS